MGLLDSPPTASPGGAWQDAIGAGPAPREPVTSKVSAIVVSFHHGAVVGAALGSLGVLGGDLAEVLVIDNAGDLGESAAAAIGSVAPTVHAPGGNLGFAAAVNSAAARAHGSLLLLLSPDAEIVSWDSARLARELTPDVGAIGAFTLDHHGRPAVSWGEFPGVGRLIRRLVGVDRRRRRTMLRRLSRGSSLPVPWVLGAALVIRRTTLLAAGGLDAAYFASGDDQDLAARLRRAGLSSVVSPAWQVRHEPRDPRSRLAQIRANDQRFVTAYGNLPDRLAWGLLRRTGGRPT